MNTEEEHLSERMNSFKSVGEYFFGIVKDVDYFFQSYVSCAGSNDYEYSKLYQPSCRAMSSIISNEDLLNQWGIQDFVFAVSQLRGIGQK